MKVTLISVVVERLGTVLKGWKREWVKRSSEEESSRILRRVMDNCCRSNLNTKIKKDPGKTRV